MNGFCLLCEGELVLGECEDCGHRQAETKEKEGK